MMKNKRPISTKVFLKNVDMTPMLDEDETPLEYIEYSKLSDKSTQTYKSTWGSKVMFLQTAEFEFIFV